MSEIKSLADQLKFRLQEQKESKDKKGEEKLTEKTGNDEGPPVKKALDPRRVSGLLSSLREFDMEGQEKILIRIDKRTMNKLRQFKAASNVDMTRVIVFSLHHFLKSHPWLTEYISQTLKNMTHELD